MSSTAGSPSSPPAGDPKAAAPAGEEDRIASLDERFGAIEAEQKEQRGILGRIEQALTGGQGKAPAGPSSTSDPAADPGAGSIAEQVRRGVEEIEARKQKEAADKAAADADAAWRASVDERLPERRPAAPATGRKTRLQAFVFGKPDQR